MKREKKLLLNILSFPRNVVGNLNRLVVCKDEGPDYKSRGRQHFIKAFTLIELLVVVLIIGILSAIALPQYQKAVEKAKATQAWTLLKGLDEAQNAYYLTNHDFASSFAELGIDIPFTGTIKGHDGSAITDALSNKDWSVEIHKQSPWFIFWLTRISGDYSGAGFAYIYHFDTGITEKLCFEREKEGFIFKKNSGDYCTKIFGLKPLKNDDTWHRLWDILW